MTIATFGRERRAMYCYGWCGILPMKASVSTDSRSQVPRVSSEVPKLPILVNPSRFQSVQALWAVS